MRYNSHCSVNGSFHGDQNTIYFLQLNSWASLQLPIMNSFPTHWGYQITDQQGWCLLSQFPPFRWFPNFTRSAKHTLTIACHVYNWRVSPHLSYGDTCQIWMWFEQPSRYFARWKFLLNMKKLMNGALVTSTPDYKAINALKNKPIKVTLRWRHNGCDYVSNHQPHHCLLNRLFRRRSKKTSNIRVTGLCVGNSPGPVNSPHKWPVTRKMFPFDDVIMWNFFFTSW